MKMTKDIILNIPQDCDNAPKRRVIRDFIIAFYQNDWEAINDKLEDIFSFTIVGNRTIKTKEDLKEYLYRDIDVIELTIYDVLSHGKYGACNGCLKTRNEEISFAYFFHFQSAGKNGVSAISEYMIASH
ncbi:MAG TPA: hypothetical protein VGN64_08155 [Dyadobacter sp.]|jgi:hypothetical protein|nr:hypothetical protein [Dyadobacter sp.]